MDFVNKRNNEIFGMNFVNGPHTLARYDAESVTNTYLIVLKRRDLERVKERI